MLTPIELLEVVDTMQPLVDELKNWITRDIIRRMMARFKREEDFTLTGTDEWQIEVYKAAGGHYEALQREIKRFTKKSDREVKEIFEDIGVRAWEGDNAFYANYGFDSVSLFESENMLRLLEDTYKRTNGEIHNLTRTTAEMSQQKLIKVLDTAHFKVMSGAQSYTQAVKDAVNEIIDTQAAVRYPSGHIDTIETAILRAVRTGTGQASGNITMQGLIDRDWDLIRVSAHLGARYGDGGQNPSNHFWWQGKLYSRTGRTKEYPLFEEATGYGAGEGLCGWNCRHSFGPGDPNHNPYKDFDEEENKKAYDLSQKQRRAESRIRKTKTKLIGLREAIDNAQDEKVKETLQEEYNKEASKLTRYNAQYDKFCKDNNLKKLNDRISVAKWNRSEAAKARKAANTEYREWSKSLGINTDPKTLAKYYDMKYNNPKEYELFQGYIKDVNKGDISPLIGYDLYKNTANVIRTKLVGTTTIDGIKIEDFTPHFVSRIIGQTSTPHEGMRQGTPVEHVFEALVDGFVSKPYVIKTKRGFENFDDTRQNYTGSNAKVTISITENKLIQANPIS